MLRLLLVLLALLVPAPAPATASVVSATTTQLYGTWEWPHCCSAYYTASATVTVTVTSSDCDDLLVRVTYRDSLGVRGGFDFSHVPAGTYTTDRYGESSADVYAPYPSGYLTPVVAVRDNCIGVWSASVLADEFFFARA